MGPVRADRVRVARIVQVACVDQVVCGVFSPFHVDGGEGFAAGRQL